jgi:hypothetical protein
MSLLMGFKRGGVDVKKLKIVSFRGRRSEHEEGKAPQIGLQLE